MAKKRGTGGGGAGSTETPGRGRLLLGPGETPAGLLGAGRGEAGTAGPRNRAIEQLGYLRDRYDPADLEHIADDDGRTWDFYDDELEGSRQFDVVMQDVVSWADFDVVTPRGTPTDELILVTTRQILYGLMP